MLNKTGSPRFRVQSPFLQGLKARFGKVALWLVLLLVPLFLLRGCVVTYVPPDALGVRQVAIGSGRGLQSKVAELAEALTRAEGEFEQAKRNADAYLVRRQQEAQAILAEKSAQAEGIRKERAALNSSAGDAYVNLQLIEALQKKEIRQIPRLPGGNVIIDGNKLLQQLGVTQYMVNRQLEETTPPQ